MSAQMMLRLKRPIVAGDDPRIGRMVGFLRGRGWTKRGVVSAALGIPDRIMRALKENTELIISSTRGYCHWLECPIEEFDEAIREQESRVKREAERLQRMYARRHQRSQTSTKYEEQRATEEEAA
jgi:hypothetical protein